MSKRRALLLTIVMAVAVLVTAACGGGGAGSSAAGGAPTVRYGVYEPGLDSGFLLMAQEKQLWRKHGVNVEISRFKSAAQAFPALLSGQVDVIQANPSEALLAAEKGAKLGIIGSTMPGLDYVLYAKPKFGSVKDLAGATLGIATPNSLPTVTAKAILMASGVDPGSVKLVNSGGSPDRYHAVVGGVVDAASSPLDYVSQAKTDGVKVLAKAKDTVPRYPRYVLVARKDFLAEHPDGAVGLIAGLVEGIRYGLDHEQEAEALAAKTVGGLSANDPRVTSLYREFKDGGYLASNGEIPVDGIKYVADLQFRLGLADKVIDPTPLIDDSFRHRAIAQVGQVASTYYGATHGG
ncbi:MAG: ABC transporter substrate-binding protein [Pseudonocardia sp.]|nr:ABC transporter substrate-binding protein [Pseudonocardia sp.]